MLRAVDLPGRHAPDDRGRDYRSSAFKRRYGALSPARSRLECRVDDLTSSSSRPAECRAALRCRPVHVDRAGRRRRLPSERHRAFARRRHRGDRSDLSATTLTASGHAFVTHRGARISDAPPASMPPVGAYRCRRAVPSPPSRRSSRRMGGSCRQPGGAARSTTCDGHAAFDVPRFASDNCD